MTLTPEQAKELLAEEERKADLEKQTKQAIGEARAVLASTEALERRKKQLAELKTHTAELRRIHEAITKADSQLYSTCGAWITACLTRTSLDDQLINVSSQIGKLSQKLSVDPPQGMISDKSIFRKNYTELGQFIATYEENFLRHGSRGELSSFEYFPPE